MENWKQWLIVSGVVSIICGVIAGIMWGTNLFIFDPGGHPAQPEPMYMVNTYILELWWIIPVAMLVGN
ncbi:MAG: hypothetical protein ACFFKA_21590 [Candidatus Thorarchaeota archaeon]